MMLFQSMSGVSSFKKVDSVDMMDQNRTNVVQTCKSENGRPLPALPPRHCLSADFLLSSTSRWSLRSKRPRWSGPRSQGDPVENHAGWGGVYFMRRPRVLSPPAIWVDWSSSRTWQGVVAWEVKFDSSFGTSRRVSRSSSE